MYLVLSLLVAATVAAANPITTPLRVEGVNANPLAKRVLGTSTVNLNNNTGTPNHLASGVLYGIPDTPNQIPDVFYTDMGFNYARAGGAQVPAPGRGWIWGLSEYKVRFASALSNYRTARKYDAPFIFLIHDLWGADGTQNSTAPYPGDNGNWEFWDAYLTQWISDMNANHATVGLSIDLWNEPDLTYFWNAPQAQYLQMWGRTYHRLRKEWPDVLLIGPAFANQPSTTNDWWTNFMSFVASNSSVPDQWVWHMETGGGDMEGAYGSLIELLETYKLPNKPLNIDEYSTYPEQVPAGSAWWIGQLERVNAHGLRGNWLSGWQLHDFLASLLSKPDAGTTSYSETAGGYYTTGDYQVYKYYNLNMIGHRVGTTPSADLKIDTYATVGRDMVRILCGVRTETGTWQIAVNDLSSVGLAESGTLNIHTYGFPTNGYYGDVDTPSDLGWVEHSYYGNSVTFPIFQVDTTTAYAFEFYVG